MSGPARWGAWRLLLPCLAACAVTGAGAASVAADTGPAPSTTTLTASAAAISPAQSVTIVASVDPGYFADSTTSVRFVDTSTKTVLGTATPDQPCQGVKQLCRFTLTVPGSALRTGTNQITGTYSGDAAQAPSSGSVVVNVGSATTCPSGSGTCDTGPVSNPTGTVQGSIDSPAPPSGVETIVLAFGGPALPCTTSGTGDLLDFTVTNAGGVKTITYTVSGASADAAEASHPLGYVCYESPSSFTTASGTPAGLDASGMYAGVLPFCSSGQSASPPPCLQSASYTPAAGATPSRYTEVVEVTQSDPRISH